MTAWTTRPPRAKWSGSADGEDDPDEDAERDALKRGVGELAVWILLICALALDIAAALWGTVLTVVIFSFAALVAAGTLKMGGRS